MDDGIQKRIEKMVSDMRYQLLAFGDVIIKDGKVLDPVSDKEAFNEAEREFLEEERKR